MALNPRILVIRGGAIGDFILTLPALKLLRDGFPDARIEILGYRHIVALADGRFYADATRSIEYGPLSRFFIPNAELAPDLVEYFGGFGQIISYLFDPDRIFETNVRRCGVKHFLHGSPKIADSAHAAEQLASPLQSLALYLEDHAATVHPSRADREFAAHFLKDLAPPIVALHPGSGALRKNWPLERWRSLVEWLARHPARPALLIVGGEADAAGIAALGKIPLERPPRIADSLPLPELGALLERCALFLGHDSGISHLAAAAGARCLLLFGPTDPDVWAPANRRVRVLAAPGKSLEHLALETVREAAAELLDQAACPP